MSGETPANPRDARPRAGCWFLVIPVLLTVVMVMMYLAVGVAGYIGRAPKGDVVRIAFEGCRDAAPLVEARALGMGLGDVQTDEGPGGFSIIAQLPAEERVATAIPQTLATPGHFEMVDADGAVLVTDDDVETAVPHLKLQGDAVTIVQIRPQAQEALTTYARERREGKVTAKVDGVVGAAYELGQLPRNQQVEIAFEGTPQDKLDAAAATAIAIANGPLPCPVRVEGVEVLEPATAETQ